MSELQRDPLIITVSEFRKLTGKNTAHFSDEQVAEMINKLDFMAELFIQNVKSRKEAATAEKSSS